MEGPPNIRLLVGIDDSNADHAWHSNYQATVHGVHVVETQWTMSPSYVLRKLPLHASHDIIPADQGHVYGGG